MHVYKKKSNIFAVENVVVLHEMVLLVLYKLSDNQKDYGPFFNEIKDYDAVQLFDNAWLIQTEEKTSDVVSKLRQRMSDKGDTIFVSVVNRDLGANGFIPAAAVAWLRERL